MKKFRLLVLLVVLFTLIVSACSKKEVGVIDDSKDENFNKEGFPIVDEEIKLDFFAGQAPASNPDWNNVLLYNKYKEMTNINVNWRMVPLDSLEEQRNLAFSNKTLPDAFHGIRIGSMDLLKYGEQGLFIPLNDLIDEFAPNFKALMDKYPDVKEAITMPDGNIYSFPQLGDPEFISYRMGPKPFIRKDLLDEMNMKIPETTDEFYNYLTKVKDEYGKTPFGSPGIGVLVSYLRGSFGLANKGSGAGYMDLDPESGDYRFWPASEQYKEMLEYLNKLYTEKLIAQNIFTIDDNQFYASLGDGEYGSTVWYSPLQLVGKETSEQLTPLPVLEGPHGDQLWTTLYDAVISPGAFILTKDNKNPAATVRWIDYFYGDEGLKTFFMGFEGETYELDEDGNPVYMDHILNSKDGLSLEQEAAKYLTYPGGGFPTMTTEQYFQGAESQPDELEAADKLTQNLIEDSWLAIQHTGEETKELRTLGTDIEKYVLEMRDKFITGSEPLSKFDDYVKELEKMNLERYIEIKKEAIERKE